MKQEIKAKWIAGMRSGQYTQGHTYLRDTDNRYCPLGILCDVTDPTVWIAPVIENAPFKMYGDIEGQLAYFTHFPSPDIINLIEATEHDKYIFGKIINMCDRDDKTLVEIADYVETTIT